MGSNAWLRAGPGAAGLMSPGVGIPEVLSHYEVVVSFKDVFLDSAVSCHTACTIEATPSEGALGSYYRAVCVTQFSYLLLSYVVSGVKAHFIRLATHFS